MRAAHAKSFAGKVVGVIDGDTITVMREDSEAVSESSPGPLQGPQGVRRGSPKRVRLYGVDAPEMGQDYGIRARKLVRVLAGGRKVTVKCRGTDEHGTTLADVILIGQRSLNREIVRAGYAWCYGSKDEILERLQAQARKKKIGLWAGRKPVAPWVYKRLLKEQAGNATSGSGIQFAIQEYQEATVPAAKQGQPSIAVSSPAEQTVYVTKTGKKYHRAGCRSLRKGRIPMTLEEAAEKGYKPCRICKPPSPDLSENGRPPGPGGEPDERLKPERVIHTGPRGGKYYYSKSGRKVYIKKK